MTNSQRHKLQHPLTLSQGRRQILGGVIAITCCLPCYGFFIASALFSQAVITNWDLGVMLLSAVIVGGSLALTFGPFWLVMLFLGIRQISAGHQTSEYGQQLSAEGVTTEGVIIDRWIRWRRNSRRCCVTYQFEAHSGGNLQTITRAEINPTAYRNYGTGSRVPVRYLPETPEICRLESPDETASL